MSDMVVAAVPAQIAEPAAAVEITQIQADRDVAIAAENTAQTVANNEATVAVAEIEAYAEDEDMVWLRGELDGLRAQCETQRASLSAVESLLTAQGTQIAELTGLLAGLTAPQLIPPQPSPEEPIPEEPIPATVVAEDGLRGESEPSATVAKQRRNLRPL